MRCPNCNSNTLVQRTYVITPYLRDIVHRCRNEDCCHIFVTQQEFIRSVVLPITDTDSPVTA
ncbi:MAG: ogr/Delta-like zinc finger family protein [Psychrobacter alimentarius]|uniref:ogr/Delta-like zinc finger family protein n=1 Tax=Psychrobacter alimentarius TaxID=261164 RepID=UPI003FBA06AB